MSWDALNEKPIEKIGLYLKREFWVWSHIVRWCRVNMYKKDLKPNLGSRKQTHFFRW